MCIHHINHGGAGGGHPSYHLAKVLQEESDTQTEMAQLRTERRLSDARCWELEELLAQKDADMEGLETLLASKLASLQSVDPPAPPEHSAAAPLDAAEARNGWGGEVDEVAELRERVMHLEHRLGQVNSLVREDGKIKRSYKDQL